MLRSRMLPHVHIKPSGSALALCLSSCFVCWKEMLGTEEGQEKEFVKAKRPSSSKRFEGTDQPNLASGTGGKSLASLRQSLPEGSLTLGASSLADIPTHVTVPSSRVADAPVYTAGLRH
ncbi:hypothetical protein Tco_0461367 [Tanacetum coccineum]